MVCCKKDVFNRKNLAKLLDKLTSGESEILSLRGTDQPLFNYLVARTDISFYNFAYSQPEQVTGNHWSSEFDIINNILYDKGRRLTYLHYMSISSVKFTQLCAGEYVEVPYRDVFLYYRYLKSPEMLPKLSYSNLLVLVGRNLKIWVIQKVNNVKFKLRSFRNRYSS